MNKRQVLLIVCWVFTFTFGFGVSRLWDIYHMPHIIMPNLTHIGPYTTTDKTMVRWYGCDDKDQEIVPPHDQGTLDERVPESASQERWNEQIRCLRTGRP